MRHVTGFLEPFNTGKRVFYAKENRDHIFALVFPGCQVSSVFWVSKVLRSAWRGHELSHVSFGARGKGSGLLYWLSG